MNKTVHILFALCLVFVSSCFAPPQPTEPMRAASFVQPASYSAGQSAQLPEKVEFPDMVEKESLQAQDAEDEDEIQAALKELEEEQDSNFSISSHRGHNRFYIALFRRQISPRSRLQVKIPETGSFELVLEEGPHFQITDNDATDGSARIQIPAGVLRTYIHLHGSRRRQSQMKIEDPLYHVEDTLTGRFWNRWMKLGKRPVPVPSDWHSDDGNTFVLKMTSQEVRSFHMMWLRRSGNAPFPPGRNEIGPEGGLVELPGVASLNIPAGALNEATVISMKQVESAFKAGTIVLFPGEPNQQIIEGMSYASPLVELQPHGLSFIEPAKIKIQNTKPWQHHPDILLAVLMEDIPKLIKSSEEQEHLDATTEFLEKNLPTSYKAQSTSPLNPNEIEYLIYHFSYIAKMYPAELDNPIFQSGYPLNTRCVTSSNHASEKIKKTV